MKFPKELKLPKAISNSQLSAFKRSPQHWIKYLKEREDETKKEAYILGSLVHCLALDKEKLTKDFQLLDLTEMPEPEKDFRTKVNREWKNSILENANGKTVIDSNMMEQAKNMANSLYEDDEARRLLQEGKEFEKEFKWKYQGIQCHGIKDISNEEFIAELKTTRNAEPWKFQRDLFSFGYYRQGGMYLDGEMKGNFVGDPHKRFYFIAVESVEPYGVSVHELDAEVITFGVSEYRNLLTQLKECIESDYFPSYQHRNINGIFDVFLPNFILND